MAKKKVTTTTTTVVTTVTEDAPKAARILFVLDRSGSMESIKQEAINGFNKFLKDQQALPGTCSFSLMLFDNLIEDPHVDVAIKDVPQLTEETFVPRGMTALYDAVGTMLKRYEFKNEAGVKTILVILTDGEENSSKEYNKNTVSKVIKKLEDEHGWETLFLGSGFNVDAVADSMNVKKFNRMKFDANTRGSTLNSYGVVSASATAYRSAGPAVNMSVIDTTDATAVQAALDAAKANASK